MKMPKRKSSKIKIINKKAISTSFWLSKIKEIKRSDIFHYFFVLFLILLLFYNSFPYIDFTKERKDSIGYLAMGYNFYKYGVFSTETNDNPNPTPTTRREPIYPTYLALYMLINPNINKNTSWEQLRTDSKLIKQLKYSQIFILLITALLAMYAIILITKKRYWGYFAFCITGFSTMLKSNYFLSRLLTELLTAFLILLLAIILYKLFKQQKISDFIFLGLTLAILVLTKAQFMYFIIFIFLFLFYGFYKKVFKSRKKFLIGLIGFSAVYSLIVGGWMMRNYLHFKTPMISERGGAVLYTRAKKNMMNKKEFLGSFLYWADNKYLKNKLNNFFGKNASGKGGALERLNRSNDSSFYQEAQRERLEIQKKYSDKQNGKQLADNEIKKLAIQQITQHPLRHILMTLPFAWRGFFTEKGFEINKPCYIQIGSPILINSLYFGSIFFLFFFSLKRKQLALASFCLPAIYLFGFQSFLTHNIPRYNVPLIPILVVGFLICLNIIIKKQTKEK